MAKRAVLPRWQALPRHHARPHVASRLHRDRIHDVYADRAGCYQVLAVLKYEPRIERSRLLHDTCRATHCSRILERPSLQLAFYSVLGNTARHIPSQKPQEIRWRLAANFELSSIR